MLPFLPTSFGDIITAADLALSIYKALSDSTGASYEYQCLVNELHSFRLALLFLQTLVSASPPSEAILKDIKEEAATCLRMLDKFADRIKSYQKKLGEGAVGRNTCRKIGWGLFKAKEVADFREKLAQHKQNITLFLGGLDISLSLILRDETSKGFESMKQEMSMVLPRSVGFGLENAIILKDAFGKPITLPMDFCYSPDELHKTLMRYFQGKIGERHVKEHEYRISSEDGMSIANRDPVLWCSVVKKGAVLVMSMEVRKETQSAHESELKRRTCPRCGRTAIGVLEDGGWLECRRCERRFNSADGEMSGPLFVNDDDLVDFRNFYIVLFQRLQDDLLFEATHSDQPSNIFDQAQRFWEDQARERDNRTPPWPERIQ